MSVTNSLGHACVLAIISFKLLTSAVSHAAGHAYAAVISACAAGGQWQQAVKLFDDMLAWQIKPDVVSCTALITALGADAQWERAAQVSGWCYTSLNFC